MRFFQGLACSLGLSVLAACGSAASGNGFGPTDASIDVSLGGETGVLHIAEGGKSHNDGTTHTLMVPDSGGGDGSCPNGVSCLSEGVSCGLIPDGCGGMLNCGSCPTGETCGGSGTAGVCGSACTPTTCTALGFGCGPAGDGCGGMLDCGSCSDAETCGGGGTPSQCGSASMCTPTTCTALGFSCGPAGDGCGGMLDCGTCTAPLSCGGGGTASKCGSPACTPKTCGGLALTCGPASDGCGNVLECGSCTAPQACGGGGTHGQCGCTGTCAEIPVCSGSGTTTLSGKVYDPADVHPLYNVLVYIPNNPADPALTTPFPAGVTCEQCGGATAGGNPLVVANTAPDGSFTLNDVPVGASIPLVIELGRWRRQFTVNVATSCGPNSITTTNTTPVKWLSATQPPLATTGHLTMPTSSALGDIPRISVVTGGFDPMECVLRKMGIADSEFTDPGGAGHVQFYLANETPALLPPSGFGPYASVCPPNPYGSGAMIDNKTPTAATLFGTTGASPTINQYDVVLLACEGYEENEQADWPNLGAYTSAGGRVVMSHYNYAWMAASVPCTGSSSVCPAGTTCEAYCNDTQENVCTSTANCKGGAACTGFCVGTNNVKQNPAYAGVVTWDTFNNYSVAEAETATVDTVSNPVGSAFETWLQDVNVVGAGKSTMNLDPVYENALGVTAPTQQWLYWKNSTAAEVPIQFTFNTPVGATAADQCGKAVFMDWHAESLGFAGNWPQCPYEFASTAPYYSHGMTFPTECDTNPMTPQEAVLEFMLFDASSCVTPYQATCASESCSQQGISCGPAGDGCGNLLNCGTCTPPATCGGGGDPGVCGNSCTPTTCTALGVNCGPAGDGCGDPLNCGTCPAGQTCGGGGMAGVCGTGKSCVPETCIGLGIACGPAGDGCGGSLSCGTCPAGQACGGGGKAGQCGTTCTPTTCTALGFNCGPAGDGCGNQLNCGTCTGTATCGGGGTPGQCGSGGPK